MKQCFRLAAWFVTFQMVTTCSILCNTDVFATYIDTVRSTCEYMLLLTCKSVISMFIRCSLYDVHEMNAWAYHVCSSARMIQLNRRTDFD
jgi:hypothetical protein